MTTLAVVAWFALGVFTWFFFEYVLHRFAFHDMKGRNFGKQLVKLV